MDCYLCGATNAPDSDYCHRCDGQLLHISQAGEDAPEPTDPMAPPPIPGAPAQPSASSQVTPPPIPGAPSLPGAPPIPDTDTKPSSAATGGAPDVPPLPDLSNLDNNSPNADEDIVGHASLEALEAQVAAEEAEALVEAEAEELAAKQAEQEPEEASSKRSQSSLKTVEHQRLQEALGIEDDNDLGIGEINVTSVPTVRQTGYIPVIGTSTASSEDGGQQERSTTKLVVFGFIALIVIAGWLGFTILNSSDDTPERIAFSSTTAPEATTSTTAAPRPWSSSEVEGSFEQAFVTVVLYECATTLGSEEETPGVEPTNSEATGGIAIDTFNAVISNEILPNANLATVRSRLGATIFARVHEHNSGARIVNFPTRINQFVSFDPEVEDPTAWHLRKDITTNEVSISEQSEAADVELQSSAFGEAIGVRAGDVFVNADDVMAIEYRSSLTIPGSVNEEDVCDVANHLFDETPVELPDEDVTSSDDETTE